MGLIISRFMFALMPLYFVWVIQRDHNVDMAVFVVSLTVLMLKFFAAFGFSLKGDLYIAIYYLFG